MSRHRYHSRPFRQLLGGARPSIDDAPAEPEPEPVSLSSAVARAGAAAGMHDPSDVLVYLDDVDEFVDEHGHADADAITAAVAELVERKPYLRDWRATA